MWEHMIVILISCIVRTRWSTARMKVFFGSARELENQSHPKHFRFKKQKVSIGSCFDRVRQIVIAAPLCVNDPSLGHKKTPTSAVEQLCNKLTFEP